MATGQWSALNGRTVIIRNTIHGEKRRPKLQRKQSAVNWVESVQLEILLVLSWIYEPALTTIVLTMDTTISTIFAFDAADKHLPRVNAPPIEVVTRGYQQHEDGTATRRTEGQDVQEYDTMTVPNPLLAHRPRPVQTMSSEAVERCASTPPLDIIKPTTQSKDATDCNIQTTNDVRANATPRAHHMHGKAHKKKKRAPKKSAITALSTVRGFTPATSADEDSDFSTGRLRGRKETVTPRSSSVVRKDLNLEGLSPESTQSSTSFLRSASPGGVSALSRQLENLSSRSPSLRPTLVRNSSKLASSETPSSVSVTSETEGGEEDEDITSYEVNLEHDFVSTDACEDGEVETSENAVPEGGILRKMHATDFEPLRCLGKGTFGTVLLVRQQRTGRLYAQKQFRKASLTVRKHLVEQTKTERAILESINRHPFVVKLYYAFQDHEKLYLILEYAQGGELFEHMKTAGMLPEETACFYMAELVLALEHLHHTVGVVYRDLKPENCLLDAEGHLLLTDFGLSKVAVDGEYRCKSMAGTMEYMAPEVILEQEYDTAVDWWSFGVLGFDMITTGTPFRAGNDMKTKQNILNKKPAMPFYMSADAKDLFTRLLRKEPKKRLGANMPKDMQIIKGHRFFRKIDWRLLDRRELEPPIKPLITDPAMAENFASSFTDLALSPVTHSTPWDSAAVAKNEHDPFGGFSFVGSRSLLESEAGPF